MTRLLALETSGQACSVALRQGGEIIEHYEVIPRLHARKILPMINDLLAQTELKLNQIDAIAFTRGPGSFTGIRIATGIAQGLGFGLDIPLLPVSTLATLAQTVYREYNAQQVMTVLDAHMKEVYWGCYREQDGLMELLGEEQIGSPESLQAAFPREGRQSWVGAGDGWHDTQNFPEAVASGVLSVYPDCCPRAQDLLRLALRDYRAGLLMSPESAQPAYLRGKSAWRKWQE